MYQFQPAAPLSVIARPKANGPGEHWGVLISGNVVAHNTPERGEHVSTLAEFAPQGVVRVVRQVPVERANDSLLRIQAAVQCRGAPAAYHPMKNNCQSFANRVTGEAPRSPTADAIVLVGIAGMLVLAHARSR